MKESENRALVLDWMARVRVAGLEALACGVGLSERRARAHVAGLEKERLVRRSLVGDGGGPVVVATAKGIRRAGREPNSRTTTKSITGLLHGRGVSWVAAFAETRGREWIGPGELRTGGWQMSIARAGPGPSTHMPDLGMIMDGERWAVEFERTPKSRKRLTRILQAYRRAELDGRLAGVIYVCATDYLVRFVQEVSTEVVLDRAVRPLDWVIESTRAEQLPRLTRTTSGGPGEPVKGRRPDPRRGLTGSPPPLPSRVSRGSKEQVG